ncbi:hypothetical protein [Fluviicola sp.]|uniref:hypothetical protein n=1 Tax=Fluviicola sp. TaxID=1917219 RepID=UPI00260F3AC5|nr:hypothetical protein [Fluviicola sp.]
MGTEICKIVSKNSALAALKNEDLLDVQLTVVEVPTAIQEISDCHKYLKINNHEIQNLTVDSIQYNTFDSLFKEATNLRGTSTQSYITGLKVSLGIKAGNMFLVFQPVYLSKSTDVLNEPNRYYVHEGLHYYYKGDSDGFVPAKAEDLTALVCYHDTIQIKHLESVDFKPFNDRTDSKAVIIPFQVIFSLIYDNENNTDVFLFNAVVKRVISGTNQVNHTVLIGANNDEAKGIHGGLFTGKYANRSHLCPPCSYVDTLVIERPGPTICTL